MQSVDLFHSALSSTFTHPVFHAPRLPRVKGFRSLVKVMASSPRRSRLILTAALEELGEERSERTRFLRSRLTNASCGRQRFKVLDVHGRFMVIEKPIGVQCLNTKKAHGF